MVVRQALLCFARTSAWMQATQSLALLAQYDLLCEVSTEQLAEEVGNALCAL